MLRSLQQKEENLKEELKNLKQYENKISSVYVTLNKPFKTLQELFKREKIDIQKIFFIDAVTKTSERNAQETGHYSFVGTPADLTSISLKLDNAAVVSQFIHHLSSKMREWKVKGIIVAIHKEIQIKLNIFQVFQYKINFRTRPNPLTFSNNLYSSRKQSVLGCTCKVYPLYHLLKTPMALQ